MVPLNLFSSAGMYATTINYVWPLGMGLYCLSCMKEYFKGKKEWYFNILYFIFLIISSNQEQMCALLIGFLFLFNVVYIWKYHKLNWILVISLMIVTGMLAFELVCPGNTVRNTIAARGDYPEYESFNFLQKIMLGFFSTFSASILNINSSICLLLISIILIGLTSKKDVVKVISFIPSFIAWVLIQCSAFLSDSGIGLAINQYTEYLPSVQMTTGTWLYLLCILIGIGCIVYVLFNTLDKKVFFCVCIILLAGFMDHFVIGFTASVFSSGLRTFIFMYYLILLVDGMLIDNLLKK